MVKKEVKTPEELMQEMDSILLSEELLMNNENVKEYIAVMKSKKSVDKKIKTYLNDWISIDNTEKTEIVVNEAYGYNPQKLREIIWVQAEEYIEQKVNTKALDKAMKDWIVDETAFSSREVVWKRISIKANKPKDDDNDIIL